MRRKQTLLSDAEFSKIVAESTTLRQVVLRLRALGYGAAYRAMRNRIDRLKLNLDHFLYPIKGSNRPNITQRSRWVWTLTDAEFTAIAKQVSSYNMFARAVGRKTTTKDTNTAIRARAQQLGVDLSHFIFSPKGAYKAEAILRKSSVAYRRNATHLCTFLLKNGIKEHKCENPGCIVGPLWNNKPVVLAVLQVNGDRRDFRPENLRLYCANCMSQAIKPKLSQGAKYGHAARKRQKEIEYYKALAK